MNIEEKQHKRHSDPFSKNYSYSNESRLKETRDNIYIRGLQQQQFRQKQELQQKQKEEEEKNSAIYQLLQEKIKEFEEKQFCNHQK